MTASIFKERYRKQQAWKQHKARGVARIFGQGGPAKIQVRPRKKISGQQHFKSSPFPSTTFLVKNFPDNNITIAFRSNFHNFPTGLNNRGVAPGHGTTAHVIFHRACVKTSLVKKPDWF